MKKYRFLLAFVLSWIASSVTLYFLEIIWSKGAEISTFNNVVKTFGMTVGIIVVLFVGLNKSSKNQIK